MKLTLHIGHGKTGSSALQSFLSLNESLLCEYGIYYPEIHTFDAAKKGYISSGNLAGVKKYDEAIYQATSKKILNHYLFSNETLMVKMLADSFSLQRLAREFTLELILYCRDPLDHVFSSYGQSVKREGCTMTMAKWLDSYKRPQQVAEMITLCEDIGVTLKLINYSKIDSIEKSFCDVLLGEKSNDFLQSAQFTTTKIVNRSLSRVEYEIQRKFNKYLGAKSSIFISDTLVNNAPDIRSEKEYIGTEDLKKFIQKHQNSVNYINTFLDKDKQLELKIPRDIKSETDKYEISSKQIAVLAESISTQIHKLSNSDLENKDADYLRDIALKFENKKPLTLEDAHYLMGLAHKARPEGPMIKQKLEIYEKSLF